MYHTFLAFSKVFFFLTTPVGKGRVIANVFQCVSVRLSLLDSSVFCFFVKSEPPHYSKTSYAFITQNVRSLVPRQHVLYNI